VDEDTIMNESLASGSTLEEALTAIATAKAMTVTDDGSPKLVIAADSTLRFEGEVMGKPDGRTDIAERWARLRGKTGELITAHALRSLPVGSTVTGVEHSLVHFAAISQSEIDAYAKTAEPLMAAGAFTLEGLGSAFISRIEGSASNVQGLSLPLLRELTKTQGIEWVSLWRDVD
jgi:septum formation protein